MKIPKAAIEKAVEGGWKPFRTVEVVGDCKWEHGSERWAYYSPGSDSPTATIHDYKIALDPSFWQALGKSCGWEEYIGPVHYDLEPPHSWHWYATEFYDLILTGGDTEAYWNDLLTTN